MIVVAPTLVTCTTISPRASGFPLATCHHITRSHIVIQKPLCPDRRCGETTCPWNCPSPAIKSLAASAPDRHRICPTAIQWPIFIHPWLLSITSSDVFSVVHLWIRWILMILASVSSIAPTSFQSNFSVFLAYFVCAKKEEMILLSSQLKLHPLHSRDSTPEGQKGPFLSS